MALAVASLAAGSALAAVSADEAKQLGTTLTAVGAEKAGNKDGTIPAVHRRHQAAGRLQARQHGAPRPVREREAAPGDHRQEHGGAGRQADRRHQGAAQALSDLARRRLSDASHRRRCRSASSTTPRRTRPARRPPTAASRSKTCWPAFRSRFRRRAPRRCGTTCCATAASATTSAIRQLERRRGRRADARRHRPTRTGRGRFTIRRNRGRSTPPIRTG